MFQESSRAMKKGHRPVKKLRFMYERKQKEKQYEKGTEAGYS